MKTLLYPLFITLLVASGWVFAHRNDNDKATKTATPTAATQGQQLSERARWEATADGIAFKNWQASPAGKRVQAGVNNIQQAVTHSSNMEAVITSLSLPPGSRLGYGLMVRIKDHDYILSFGIDDGKEFTLLKNLQVNDKIMVRSHNISIAPKYAYPIVAGDYVEQNGSVVYKKAPRKGGC